MLAFLGNFDLAELAVILIVAILVFGRRLPEVAMQGAAQLAKFRRAVTDMWREAGLEQELSRIKREVERDMPNPRFPRIDSIGDLRRAVEPNPTVDLPRATDVEVTDANVEGAPTKTEAPEPAGDDPEPRPPKPELEA